ncbi:hypothetical protein [Shewanella sp. UCD-KL21]|uniref:hypothetical protein n=1 Tax=Shewanella sp. UCD-KL21 TaxID=1917164 RepID=UPI00111597C1|nr:hypothetical protein [Shewanella sp. UCD-KL21]
MNTLTQTKMAANTLLTATKAIATGMNTGINTDINSACKRGSKIGAKTATSLAMALSLSFLTACGGGGGDDSSPPPVTPAVTTPATSTADTTTDTTPETTTPETPERPTEPEPEAAPATSIDDLVVDAYFDLQAAFTLSINVQLASSQRGYFSLCDDYQQNGTQVSVNFESCLLRGALDEGALSEELLVANHQRALMAVVWFYDGSEPIYQQWSHSLTNEPQVLVIN